jgi:putative serine protease PepD
VAAALAVGALVGGVSGAGVTLLATNNSQQKQVVGNANPATVTVNDTETATTITAVAAKASPSVVTISVTASTAAGTGSGVVLTADGYILTNTHVVTLDGEVSDPTIQVQTSDGRLLAATVVGTDPISDLAVIKVDGVTDLEPADFADSSKLNVGDTAIAIGAPLGLAGTVTDGIVSALNRSITVASSAIPQDSSSDTTTPDTGDGSDLWGFDLPGQTTTPTASSATISLPVIQTDAAINPGNSGGALLNSKGEVIGINVAIASAGGSSSTSGSIGVGFSIPSNLAQRVAQEIIDNGSATHGLLGASIVDVTEDTEITNVTTVGASVQEVSDDGAAAKAGIQAGDVITSFNGIPITGKTDLTAQVRALAAGADATVTYWRDGKASTVDVTLGALS